jgi:hypothetical protein
MAFHLFIVSNPTWAEPAIPSYRFTSPYFESTFHWSRPGTMESFDFELPSVPSFDLTVQIRVGDDFVEYTYEGITDDDHLLVFSIDSLNHVSTIFRRKQGVIRPCVVRCQDGRSAPQCIECSTAGIKVKVCC